MKLQLIFFFQIFRKHDDFKNTKNSKITQEYVPWFKTKITLTDDKRQLLKKNHKVGVKRYVLTGRKM